MTRSKTRWRWMQLCWVLEFVLFCFVSFSNWISVLPISACKSTYNLLFINFLFFSLSLSLSLFPPASLPSFFQLFPSFVIFLNYIFLGPPLLWFKSSEGKVISCPMTRFVHMIFYRRKRGSLSFRSCPLFLLIQNPVTKPYVLRGSYGWRVLQVKLKESNLVMTGSAVVIKLVQLFTSTQSSVRPM